MHQWLTETEHKRQMVQRLWLHKQYRVQEMEQKVSQALNFIRAARDHVITGKHTQARDNYIKGIQILHKQTINERDPKKKALITNQINIYLSEAEQNKNQLLQKNQRIDKNKVFFDDKPRSGKSLGKGLTNESPMIRCQTQNNLSPFNKNQRKTHTECTDKDVQEFILKTTDVSLEAIVGMKEVKKAIQEIILLPKKRPDLFQGIRAPPRGVIFYGPPGNGKTYMAKAIATESDCVFFNLSASSLVSKYVGDSERMLKRVFAEAYKQAPSIIFIDEIDSILTARSENENEASRRLKTEFLVQMDGLTTTDKDSVLCIGATNLPNELDKAALRRFPKKIYIGPPDLEARKDMIKQHMGSISHCLTQKDIEEISRLLQFYSASDIKDIAKEASMMPMRELGMKVIDVPENMLRKVAKEDFVLAVKQNPPTIGKKELEKYRRLE